MSAERSHRDQEALRAERPESEHARAARARTVRHRDARRRAGDCERVAGELGFELFFAQSNAEHEIVEWVQDAFRQNATVVINPAGFSFRSVPLLDALHMLATPDRRGAHHEHPRPRRRPPALARLVGGAAP